jgi:hypothetical protein
MQNNSFPTIDLALLDNVTGGEGEGQGTPGNTETYLGCTASAVGNAMQGQSIGGALSDWGRCVQTGTPLPQGGTPSPTQPTS